MELVAQGITFQSSCRGAGLFPKRVAQWLQKGEILEDEDLPGNHQAWQYVRFYQDFEAAKAKYETLHQLNINSNAVGHSRTRPDVSQWALKTYYPERYNDKYKIHQEAQKQVSQVLGYLFDVGDDDFVLKLAQHIQKVPGLELKQNRVELKDFAA